MKILVTGGAGFIGSSLVKFLLDESHHVVVIDNFDDYYPRVLKERNIESFKNNRSFEIFEGDIVDRDFLQGVFNKNNFDVVVHLAAKAGVRPSLEDPIGYSQVNIVGTLNILEELKDKDIKNFIFASSSSVYGNNDKVPFNENDIVDSQISPYAFTKKSGELICRSYSHLYKIPTTCLRFFTVYGPKQRPDLAIRKFMSKVLNNETIELYGDGTTSRDYTYVNDIVDGINKCINTPFNFEIFNLGNSNPIKLKDLVEKIESAMGIKADKVWKDMQKGDVERTYADTSKARELLGWSPKIKLDDGLSKMANWIKSER